MLNRRDLLLIGASGLVTATPTLAEDRLPVIATFSILGDFVRNVGGNRVAVATLVGPNGDVHVYLPTPADARKLNIAKVVFINELGLEGWMTRLVTASGTKAPIIIATKGVTPRDMKNKQEGSCQC
jgi:zinc/manganese transport system substrate-binding protein